MLRDTDVPTILPGERTTSWRRAGYVTTTKSLQDHISCANMLSMACTPMKSDCSMYVYGVVQLEYFGDDAWTADVRVW